MTKKAIPPGAVHSVPADLRKVLISDPAARAQWEDITPLARNEWICWVISVKKPKPEGSTLSAYARNLKKECAGLVAGQAVLTAEIRTAYLYLTSSSPQSNGAAPLSIPNNKSRASAHEAGALPFHFVSHFDLCNGSCSSFFAG